MPVRTSGREQVLDTVPGTPALVVSTPGAEPVADGGYAAALLLDGWAMLGRPDLRAGEEALRRWIVAAALVRGQEADGTVVIVAEATAQPVQALVRWDPVGYAVRERAERAELGFLRCHGWRRWRARWARPPTSSPRPGCRVTRRSSVLYCCRSASRAGPRRTGAPPPGEQWERALIRVPQGSGAALAAALKAAQAARLAKTNRAGTGADAVRIRIDPADIG